MNEGKTLKQSKIKIVILEDGTMMIENENLSSSEVIAYLEIAKSIIVNNKINNNINTNDN